MESKGFKFDFKGVAYEEGKAKLVSGDVDFEKTIVKLEPIEVEKKDKEVIEAIIKADNEKNGENLDDKTKTKHKFRIEKSEFGGVLDEIVVALERHIEDHAQTKKERDNANKTVSGLEKTLNNLPSIMVEGKDIEDIEKALKEILQRNIDFIKDAKVKKILSEGLEEVDIKKSASTKAKPSAAAPASSDPAIKNPAPAAAPVKPPVAPPVQPKAPDVEKASDQEFATIQGKIETLLKSFKSQLSKDIKSKEISEDDGKEKEKLIAAEADKFKSLNERFGKKERTKKLYEEMQTAFVGLEDAGKNIFDYYNKKDKKKEYSRLPEKFKSKLNSALKKIEKMSLDEFDKSQKEIIYDGNLRLYYESIITHGGVLPQAGQETSDPQFKESFKKAIELAESVIADKKDSFTIVGGVTYKILPKSGNDPAKDPSLKTPGVKPDDSQKATATKDKDAPANPFGDPVAAVDVKSTTFEPILDEDVASEVDSEEKKEVIVEADFSDNEIEKTESREDVVESFPDLGEENEKLFREMLQVYYNGLKELAKDPSIKWKRGERKEALKEETLIYGVEWFEERFPKKKITRVFVENIFDKIKK